MKTAIKKFTANGLENIREIQYKHWKKKLNYEPILHEPVFIIGCPRSGTSKFVSMFATHPWVANLSEAGQVWDPINYYNKESDHYWNSSLVTNDHSKNLHSRFEWYRQSKKKKRFVNKHPRNSVRIQYIQKIFPDAYFIHIIRDGRAVVNSVFQKISKEPFRQAFPFGNFCKPPNWRSFQRGDIIEQAAFQWREIIRNILETKNGLGDRYLEIKYEDICTNTRDVMASTFKFTGLPASLNDLKKIPKSLNSMNNKYKLAFSPAQIDMINSIQKEFLHHLDYNI